MILEVTLSTAMACVSWFAPPDDNPKGRALYNQECVPVLVGGRRTPTPVGVFPAYMANSEDPNYGIDVLVFKQTKSGYYVVHRPWKGSSRGPYYREDLLKHAPDKRKMSNGCINIGYEFYERWMYQVDAVVVKP